MQPGIPSFDDPHFTVAIVPQQRLVQMTLRGLWSADTCSRFEAHARQMIARLPLYGCPVGAHVTLIDVRDFAVQQANALGLLTTLAGDRSVSPRRRAVLNSSALVRNQMRRAIPEFAFFSDRDEALRWLMSADSDATAA